MNTLILSGTRWVPQRLQNKLYRQCFMLLFLFSHSLYCEAQPFTNGNVVGLIVASNASNNSTGSLVELNSETANQTPVTLRSIDATNASNALRFAGSATSTGYLSNSSDGSLLALCAPQTTNTSVNLNTITTRGVGTYNAGGVFSLATTYTGSSNQQARCASTINNSVWYIGDQGGFYTNGSTSASPTGNYRGVKAFGSHVYVQSNAIAVGMMSAPSGGTLTLLNGLTAPVTNLQDFYLISSGANGAVYDLLYLVYASSSTVGSIAKYSLVNGSWIANGTYTTSFGGFGLAVRKISNGAELFVSTGSGATAANSIVKVTDEAGYNTSVQINTANHVILYTATGTSTIKGVAFAPVSAATISVGASYTAFSTTYGSASLAQSISFNGTGLSGVVTATAPNGYEVSGDNINFATTATYVPSNGVVSASLYTRVKSDVPAGVLPGGNIVLSSSGVSNVYVNIPSGNILPKALTITGLSVNNKIYDGTTTATLFGTPFLVGMVGNDNVSLDGTAQANFIQANCGTFISVNIVGYSLIGSEASNYVLIWPTLTADITPATQIITFNLTSPQSLSSSPIFLNGTASSGLPLTYFSSDTSVALISGNNLILQQTGTTLITASQGGNNNYNAAPDVTLQLSVISSPTFTELIFPQYIEGMNGINNNRLPYVYRASISNLIPNANYHFYHAVVLTTATGNDTGAGGNIFTGNTPNLNFTSTSTPNLSIPGQYGSFQTDASGTYTGWFILIPTESETHFVPGTPLNIRMILNDGAGGTTPTTFLTSSNTVTVLNMSGNSGTHQGSGLRGLSNATEKNFIFVYDNVEGLGRPLSGSYIENDGLPASSGYASFYSNEVDAVPGSYGLIVPNNNNEGVRRIEQRDFGTGTIVGCPATDLDGLWPGGANTINPDGGTTPLIILSTDAALGSLCTSTSSITSITLCSDQLPYTWNGNQYNITGTYNFTTKNYCGCDSIAVLNLIVHNTSSSNLSVTACDSYLWFENGTTYTATGTYTLQSINNQGCLHTSTLQLTLGGMVTGSSYFTGCDSLTVDNTLYTSSGYHTQNYLTSTGCDSVHTYYVTIHYSNSSGSVHTACDALTIGGQTYLSSSQGMVTYTNNEGCDSIHHYYVNIYYSNNGNSNHAGCESVVVGGQTYTAQGNHSVVYINSNGCDSIHTYHVMIGHHNSGITYQTACDNLLVDGVQYNSSGYHTHLYSNVSGCDSIHTYDVTILHSTAGGSVHSSCDSIVLAGQTYGSSGQYAVSYQNVSGCDSTHTYYVSIQQSNIGQSTHIACNLLTIAGQTFTSSGTSLVHYTNVQGCDSLHSYQVTINNSNYGSSYHTACDSLNVDGVTYNSDGFHSHIYTNESGCDSVHTYYVNIHYSNNGSSLETGCDAMWVDGILYTSGGSHPHTYTNGGGCDSLHTYTVDIHYSNAQTSHQTACDELMVEGILYTQSGSHTQTYMNASGCDSVHTYDVTILASTSQSYPVIACDTYTWSVNGMTYNLSGIYTVQSVNTNGCVHTDSLILTIHTSTTNTSHITACDSYTWFVNGMSYSSSGLYTVVSTNSTGCTHTETLSLTILSSTSNTITLSACTSYTWSQTGLTYTSSGTYTATSLNASGCSHTTYLILTIHHNTSTTSGASACNSYLWSCNGQVYTQSGTYTCIGTNSFGCTHTSTLTLAIHTNTSSTVNINACNSYTWGCNGQTYTQSGVYTCSGINSAGCLQTTHLNLTVNNNTTSSQNITACNSYVWSCNGQTYTQSGTYTCLSTNIAGCIQVQILNLTIHSSTTSSQGLSACSSYTWSCNGQTYTQSGLYTCVGTNAAGCSHSSTLNLSILSNTVTNTEIVTCNSYTWGCNGQTYTQSGTYTCTAINTMGCIQWNTLNLTIHNSTSSTTQITSCDTYYWLCNNTNYTQSGNYTCVGTNSLGCSHVSILNLTILQSTSSNIGVSSCGSYAWACNGLVYNQSGTYTCIGVNNVGCPQINTLNLTIKPLPNVTANDVESCSGAAVNLVGSPTGGTYNLPNPYSGTATNYIYFFTGSNGCISSDTGSITFQTSAQVSSVAITDITSSTAKVSWQGYGVWFDIRYKPVTSSTWINAASTSGFSKLLTGLTGSSTYTVEVRAYCNKFGIPSAWAGRTFTTNTLAVCDIPIASTTTAITSSSVKLNWNHPGALYYTLRYKVVGAQNWVNAGTSSNPYKVLNGLQANTFYEYQVQAICSNSYTSIWSLSSYFNTQNLKMNEKEETENEKKFRIYPNPARETLNLLFQVEASSQVVCKLIDITGRCVRTISLEALPGIQKIGIRVDDLNKGVYTFQYILEDHLAYTERVLIE